jgi:hypothetical protein
MHVFALLTNDGVVVATGTVSFLGWAAIRLRPAFKDVRNSAPGFLSLRLLPT